MLVTTILWGTLGYSFAGLSEIIPSPIFLTFIRFTFASFFLLLSIPFLIFFINRQFKKIVRVETDEIILQINLLTRQYLSQPISGYYSLKNWQLLIFLGFIGYSISLTAYFIGFSITGIVYTNIVGLGTIAIWTAILSGIDRRGKLLTKEQFTGWKFSYLILSLIACILITLGSPGVKTSEFYTSIPISGIVVLTIFAISWTIFISLSSKLSPLQENEADGIHLSQSIFFDIFISVVKAIIQLLAGSIFILIGMLLGLLLNIEFSINFFKDFIAFFSNFNKIISNYLLEFVLLVLISTGLAYILYNFGVASYEEFAQEKKLRLSASVWMSVIGFFELIVGALVGLLILEEPFQSFAVFGSIFIFVVIMFLRSVEIDELIFKQDQTNLFSLMTYVYDNVSNREEIQSEVDDISTCQSRELRKRLYGLFKDKKGGKVIWYFVIRGAARSNINLRIQGTLESYGLKHEEDYIYKAEEWGCKLHPDDIQSIHTGFTINENDSIYIIRFSDRYKALNVVKGLKKDLVLSLPSVGEPIDVSKYMINNNFKRLKEPLEAGGQILCIKITNGAGLFFYKDHAHYLGNVIYSYLTRNGLGYISKDEQWSEWLKRSEIRDIQNHCDISEYDTAAVVGIYNRNDSLIIAKLVRELHHLLNLREILVNMGTVMYYGLPELGNVDLKINKYICYEPFLKKLIINIGPTLTTSAVDKLRDEILRLYRIGWDRKPTAFYIFPSAISIFDVAKVDIREFFNYVQHWLKQTYSVDMYFNYDYEKLIDYYGVVKAFDGEFDPRNDGLLIFSAKEFEIIGQGIRELEFLFEDIKLRKGRLTSTFFFENI